MRALGAVLLISLAGCQCSKKSETESVLLPIPDRQWAEGAPDEGWCGETSIQMVALHYGAWVPQPVANALGRSTHVDLWEEDVPTALDKLGLRYERSQTHDREEFIAWIVSHLRRGHPVIVGAKLFPTDHPDWDVDHLMPVVGFSSLGLTFNTNLDPGQVEVPYADLSERKAISFMSPTGKLYGYAVLGFEENAPQATLRVLEESADAVKFAVQVEGSGWVVKREELDGGVSTVPLGGVLEVNPRQSSRLRVISSSAP